MYVEVSEEVVYGGYLAIIYWLYIEERLHEKQQEPTSAFINSYLLMNSDKAKSYIKTTITGDQLSSCM